MSKILTIRVDDELESWLSRESAATGKSASALLRDAYRLQRSVEVGPDIDSRIERIIGERLDAMQEELKREIRERYRVPSFREYRVFYDLEIEPMPNRDPESYDFYSWLLRCARAYWRRYGKWPTPADTRQFGNSPRRFEWPNSPAKE